MYAYGIDGRLEMTLNTPLRALRKCDYTTGYYSGIYDDCGMHLFSTAKFFRMRRLADKIQARIERDQRGVYSSINKDCGVA